MCMTSTQYPQKDLNLRPPVCGTGALPLSYTGMYYYVPHVGIEPTQPIYKDGVLNQRMGLRAEAPLR